MYLIIVVINVMVDNCKVLRKIKWNIYLWNFIRFLDEDRLMRLFEEFYLKSEIKML